MCLFSSSLKNTIGLVLFYCVLFFTGVVETNTVLELTMPSNIDNSAIASTSTAEASAMTIEMPMDHGEKMAFNFIEKSILLCTQINCAFNSYSGHGNHPGSPPKERSHQKSLEIFG